jgi:hypothetical protein
MNHLLALLQHLQLLKIYVKPIYFYFTTLSVHSYEYLLFIISGNAVFLATNSYIQSTTSFYLHDNYYYGRNISSLHRQRLSIQNDDNLYKLLYGKSYFYIFYKNFKQYIRGFRQFFRMYYYKFRVYSLFHD